MHFATPNANHNTQINYNYAAICKHHNNGFRCRDNNKKNATFEIKVVVDHESYGLPTPHLNEISD